MTTTQEDKAMIAQAFDKVATFLVEHSEQADKLAKLEARVNELHDSLARYREDNGRLRQENWKTNQERNQFERELGEARTASETMGRRNQELREENFAKAQEIDGLKAEVARLAKALGDAESTVAYQARRIDGLEEDLKRRIAQNDEYFTEAVKYEEAAKAAEAKLAKVQEALGLVGQAMVKPDPTLAPVSRDTSSEPSPSGASASEAPHPFGASEHAPLPHEAFPTPVRPQEAPQSSGPIAGPFDPATPSDTGQSAEQQPKPWWDEKAAQ